MCSLFDRPQSWSADTTQSSTSAKPTQHTTNIRRAWVSCSPTLTRRADSKQRKNMGRPRTTEVRRKCSTRRVVIISIAMQAKSTSMRWSWEVGLRLRLSRHSEEIPITITKLKKVQMTSGKMVHLKEIREGLTVETSTRIPWEETT